MSNYIIFENLEKRFKYIMQLGSGGTGETVLLLDEDTKTNFAFKKYSPIPNNDSPETYDRFIDEIGILFRLNHENIVRIYNYYLYPKYMTGYIQMEYIEGDNLSTYLNQNQSADLGDLFLQFIAAFVYLENNEILHRDIKSNNFIITSFGKLKVIDFGFGKIIDSEEIENSIVLNWPVTTPAQEVYHGVYDHSTEIYYLGAMIQKEINANNIETFKFQNILEKMCQANPENRFKSFNEISEFINKDLLSSKDLFSDEQKNIFQNFINAMRVKFTSFTEEPDFNVDRAFMEEQLKSIYNQSQLHEYIPNSQKLMFAFANFSSLRHKSHVKIKVSTFEEFLEFYEELDNKKRDIVFNNIKMALSEIPIEQEIHSDDLPF